jgi:hypothetical protein
MSINVSNFFDLSKPASLTVVSPPSLAGRIEMTIALHLYAIG